MKIKVTDAKIQKLERECEIARKVMRNMDVEQPSMTEGEIQLDAMTEPLHRKIEEALYWPQMNARRRRLHASRIFQAAITAERMLDEQKVPANLRKGARFKINADNESVPRSYKYPFSNSSAIIERGSNKAWFLVEMYRDPDVRGCDNEDRLLLSPAARKHAVRSLHESLVEGIAA
tara:strand:+ start:400 stop:927 length:528 start_codon:yes stop_codon:yes gene_type:complete